MISFSLPAYLAGSGAFLPPNNAGVIFLRVKQPSASLRARHPRARAGDPEKGGFRVSLGDVYLAKKPRDSERAVSFENQKRDVEAAKLVLLSRSKSSAGKQISRGLVLPTVAMHVSIYPMCIRECTP